MRDKRLAATAATAATAAAAGGSLASALWLSPHVSAHANLHFASLSRSARRQRSFAAGR